MSKVERLSRLMTPKQLSAVLRDIASDVETVESFKGYISYTCLNGVEHTPIPEGYYEVIADYNIDGAKGKGVGINWSTKHVEDK